eukprot:33439-Rhodomonas_salina.1
MADVLENRGQVAPRDCFTPRTLLHGPILFHEREKDQGGEGSRRRGGESCNRGQQQVQRTEHSHGS